MFSKEIVKYLNTYVYVHKFLHNLDYYNNNVTLDMRVFEIGNVLIDIINNKIDFL